MLSTTTSNGDAKAYRGVYLLTTPRSASNLLQKMLSNQKVASSGYFFYNSGISLFTDFGAGPLSKRSKAEQEETYQTYRDGYEKMLAFLEEAESKGERVFVKEHTVFAGEPSVLFGSHYEEDKSLPLVGLEGKDIAHTNPTVVPDSIMKSLQPIIQIRNPMLSFPSMTRASRGVGYNTSVASDPSMTYEYSRKTYDWYLSNDSAADPLVIDADEVMNDRGAIREMCIRSGLDPDAVRYEWDTKEEPDPLKKVFLSTIGNSTGILPGLDSKGLSLEEETAKWKKEFGEEEGACLARRVQAAMPDYEYLRSRRITSASS